MEVHLRHEEQDVPLSPTDSETTVATADLPCTADWIALRKQQQQASQSLPLTSTTSFDSQETVLTEDLPATNDWLQLQQKSRYTRNAKDDSSPRATHQASQPVDKVSSPPEAKANATTEVTPNLQSTFEQQATDIEITVLKQSSAPKPDEPDSDSEATTWSIHQCHDNHSNVNASMSNNNAQQYYDLECRKSEPVSPLTQERTQRSQFKDSVQSQSVNPNGPDSTMSNARQHYSPLLEPLKSEPELPLTEERTPKRPSVNLNQSQYEPTKNDTETLSSPPLTRKRPPSPDSPANSSIGSDPLLDGPNTMQKAKARKPLAILVSNKKPNINNDDSDASTPSPPLKQKQQPWFQKKTKKQKFKQTRLKFV